MNEAFVAMRNVAETSKQDTTTTESLKLVLLVEKWKSFGWHVEYVDGHSYKSLMGGFDSINKTQGKRKSGYGLSHCW